MKLITIIIFMLSCSFGFSQTKQERILEKYLKNGAYKYHYTQQGWQDHIDEALKEDSTIALLWQNKALPYWKMKKYEQAVNCYDKAVLYDRQNYLGRRGYLKCIFQKDYKAAIVDMEMAEKEFGYGYQNDHSYQFYIALCYLQLNDFVQAEEVLQKDFDRTVKKHGASWTHYLDLFYLGIIGYERRNYDRAILLFDQALAKYPEFSDAKYYKGLCLLQRGDTGKAELLMREAKADYERRYTINEDDAFYEPYPYQVNWYMAKWTIPNYRE